MIVLDASAAVDFILRIRPQAERIASRISRLGETLHAPHLVDGEVLQVLRRYELRGIVTPERADEALGLYRDILLVRYPLAQLIDRIWALRYNLSAFDAAYLALAEALEAPLLTTDTRLARARGHRARIELFA